MGKRTSRYYYLLCSLEFCLYFVISFCSYLFAFCFCSFCVCLLFTHVFISVNFVFACCLPIYLFLSTFLPSSWNLQYRMCTVYILSYLILLYIKCHYITFCINGTGVCSLFGSLACLGEVRSGVREREWGGGRLEAAHCENIVLLNKFSSLPFLNAADTCIWYMTMLCLNLPRYISWLVHGRERESEREREGGEEKN